MTTNRRSFIGSSTSALVGGSVLGVSSLPQVARADQKLPPSRVQFRSEIEPLVQLIEDSSRDQVLKRVADRIRSGKSYQEVLTALFLAAIRNVQPRPSVGFKFHSVLVVNSCHLASLAGPDQDRWLPLFWAIDYFKSSQKDEKNRSGWQMPALKNDAQIPMGQQAINAFTDAMDRWDVEKADAASAGLVRSLGANQVFELLARYAARDYRSIGHKAIYLANGWRTLQIIGWQHAEPVIRSLVFALLNHNGEPNPAESDLGPDRSWRNNQRLLADIPATWTRGKIDDSAAQSLIECFREQSPKSAAELATEFLSSGGAAQSVWDGVFVGAGELLMRQPGIIGLHGLTTANAMHYIWQTTKDENVRKQVLLQACAFNPQFRESAKGRGKVAEYNLTRLDDSNDKSEPELPQILDDMTSQKLNAAQGLYGYLNQGGDPIQFIDDARRLLFLKGRDAHDYKFASAVLEDYYHLSPNWRNKFLATSVFNLRGSKHSDSKLVERTRAAIG